MMAVAGDLGVAERGHEISRRLASWHVVRQRGSALGERLACAQRSARSRWGDRALVVQIGMDTPQLEAHDLRVLETSSVEPDGTVVCALGPAPDGGWWGLATRHAGAADHLVGVPMSRADTCQRTAATLRAAGSRVVHVHQLRDVDTIEDAMAVAAEHPRLRFSRELGHVLGEARLQSPSSPVREKVANA
jgi:hypothetical protein